MIGVQAARIVLHVQASCIHVYVCVCVCVRARARAREFESC